METLDFIVRHIYIPVIFILILLFIPEAIKDIKDMSKLFISGDTKANQRKRKAVQAYTAATDNSNSYSKLTKYSDYVILSHK